MNIVTRNDEWLAIVNPNAGFGKGKKDWNKISLILNKYGLKVSVLFTERKLHAIELTKDGIEAGYRNIIAIGGDGTMNEVVNGVFSQTNCQTKDVNVGMIPVGSGNDWGKMFGIPKDYEHSIKIIKEKKVFLHDTGLITYTKDGEKKCRYFINIAGLGFDANVTKRTNNQKEKGNSGKAIYFYNLLKSLAGYRNIKTEIEIDGQKSINETFTISIGIGRYSGGGMMQTPHAIPDDGLFDITVIKKMSRAEIIWNLKKLYDGTILTHPKINGYTGKTIKINSDQPVYIEADGESLGHSPVELKIMPKSINIIFGRLVIQPA